MIEALLVASLSFAGGWWVGHEDSAVTVECRNEPLVTSECVDISPPADDSFGATTASYISLVGQYRKCKTACTQKANK